MARLSLFLPPFAGDYSGACSVLFGMDCLAVIVDAGCCTRNYVEYDETRWLGSGKSAFSAQLRTLDALLGDDARIVEDAACLARESGAACVALVGTPVPALVGMDLQGVAAEVEAACGVPAVGVSTTGFETYESGVAKALEALLRRFALQEGMAGGFGDEDAGAVANEVSAGCLMSGDGAAPADIAVAPSVNIVDASSADIAETSSVDGEAERLCRGREFLPAGDASYGCDLKRAETPAAAASSRLRVNVLGATPQDFMGAEALAELEDGLRAVGLDLAFSTASSYTPADVAAAVRADASIVVAASGLPAARLLRAECGVPFVVGRPFASEDFERLAECARHMDRSGRADCARRAKAARAAISKDAGFAERAVLSGEEGAAVPAAPAARTADSLSGPVAQEMAVSEGENVQNVRKSTGLEGDMLLWEHRDAREHRGAFAALPAGDAANRCFTMNTQVTAEISGEKLPVLLVGEQVAMNSLRPHVCRMLQRAGMAADVCVASFFAWEDALAEPGDVRLRSEGALQDWAREHPNAVYAGDPLLRRIPEISDAPFFALPHEAVSSTLFESYDACRSGARALSELEAFFDALERERAGQAVLSFRGSSTLLG